MELPLSISNLQEQWLLSFLKKLDPANITELFWQLRPYVVLHHVEFKESSFSFSSVGIINFVDIVGFVRKNDTLGPALLYIHRAAAEDYSPVIQLKESYNKTTPVEDFSLLEEEFRTRLQALLEEIFNPDLSFSQTEEEDRCTYCDFKEICKR